MVAQVAPRFREAAAPRTAGESAGVYRLHRAPTVELECLVEHARHLFGRQLPLGARPLDALADFGDLLAEAEVLRQFFLDHGTALARIVDAVLKVQHGLLDLFGDDVTDLAEVLALGLDLVNDDLQEAAILHLVVEEVVAEDAIGRLTVAVNAPVALLHLVGVPRDLVVDEIAAVLLEVQALGGGVGAEQDAHGGLIGRRLKGLVDRLAVGHRHAAGHNIHPVGPAALLKEAAQVVERVEILRKDEEALAIPSVAIAQVLLDPVEQGLGLGVSSLAKPVGDGDQFVEPRAFIGGEAAEETGSLLQRGGLDLGLLAIVIEVLTGTGLHALDERDVATALPLRESPNVRVKRLEECGGRREKALLQHREGELYGHAAVPLDARHARVDVGVEQVMRAALVRRQMQVSKRLDLTMGETMRA